MLCGPCPAAALAPEKCDLCSKAASFLSQVSICHTILLNSSPFSQRISTAMTEHELWVKNHSLGRANGVNACKPSEHTQVARLACKV